MKALLTSTGICTTELAQALSRLVGKPLDQINIAVINEASAVEPGDKRWSFDEMYNLSRVVGGEIDVINLLALDLKTIEQRMDFADVIYVVGGLSDYLMAVFERTGFSELLRDKLFNEKVYVGASAGSMVLGRRITTEGYRQVYRKGEQDFGVNEYLALVDFSIFPHLDSPEFIRNRIEIIDNATIDFGYPVYAIQDAQAVVVNGDEASFIGGDVAKFGNK
jgi:dipeptidase E